MKRLSPLKREYWRSLLQNWVAWVSLILPWAFRNGFDGFVGKTAYVQVEPYIDRSVGLVVPFYGWFKVLFLMYLCLTRPSVSSLLLLRSKPI